MRMIPRVHSHGAVQSRKHTGGLLVGAAVLYGYWEVTETVTWWIIVIALVVMALVDGILGYEDVRVPKVKETTEYTKKPRS